MCPIQSILCFILLLCVCTVHSTPLQRIRRQSKPIQHDDLPYQGWYGSGQNPSGGNPGAYYGSGNNPNYGTFNSPQNNAPGHGISAVSYGSDSGSSYGSNQRPYYQPQQQQYYWNTNNNNNNNNRWPRPEMNDNYNRPYNRYPPGSQGWYATGGNYWRSDANTQMKHHWFLLLGTILTMIAV